MSVRSKASTFFHRYLRIPYTLHTHEFRSPKNPKMTFVLIHGIGNSLHAWDEVVAKMPKDVRIIGIDLLGFGESPKPDWAVYNAKTQARSVGLTLLGLRIPPKQVVLVGHSLGALVAVEVARRYPLLPQRLVLCSPPFYARNQEGKKRLSGDEALKSLYLFAKDHPNQLMQLSALAVKLGIVSKVSNVTPENISSYIATLESCIINQTTLQDVQKLTLPIDIFYGTFDPVVIKKHVTMLDKNSNTITARRIAAGHEILGSYIGILAEYLSGLAKAGKNKNVR